MLTTSTVCFVCSFGGWQSGSKSHLLLSTPHSPFQFFEVGPCLMPSTCSESARSSAFMVLTAFTYQIHAVVSMTVLDSSGVCPMWRFQACILVTTKFCNRTVQLSSFAVFRKRLRRCVDIDMYYSFHLFHAIDRGDDRTSLNREGTACEYPHVEF